MAHRNLSRSAIISTLYALQMYPLSDTESIQQLITYIGNHFSDGNPDYNFVEHTVFSVIKKQSIIDDIITKAAPRWPLENMNTMDVIILRMSIYELVFEYTKTHPNIIISEAVSAGQIYVGQSSARFINGVLSTVYREMGSPMGPVRPPRIDMSAETIVTHQYKGGGFVYAFDLKGDAYVALVQDIWGFWTFPKGTCDKTEDILLGSAREIEKTIGIPVVSQSILGESEYSSFHPQKGNVVKHVTYVLAKAEFVTLTLEDSAGLVTAKWFPVTEIADLRMYDNVAQISITAINRIFNSQ